jgi:hypothetical protein
VWTPHRWRRGELYCIIELEGEEHVEVEAGQDVWLCVGGDEMVSAHWGHGGVEGA